MKDQILKMKVLQHEEGDQENSTVNEGIKPANRVSLTIDDANNKGKTLIKKGKNGQDNRIVQDKTLPSNDFSVECPQNRITTKDYELMNKDRNIRDKMDQYIAKISKFEGTRGESTNRTDATSPL